MMSKAPSAIKLYKGDLCIVSNDRPSGMLVFATVCRQSFWNQMRLKLRESLAHLIGLIMQRVACDASAAFQVSFV